MKKIKALLKRCEYAEALSALMPKLKREIPKDFSVFYTFVGDQDLIEENPLIRSLNVKDLFRVLETLRELSLDSQNYLALKGYAFICAGIYDKAHSCFSTARGLYPQNARLATLEALSLWLQGDSLRSRRFRNQALRCIEKAFELGDKSRQSLLLRAQIRFDLDDNEGGLADLEEMLKRDGQDQSALIGKAERLTDIGRYEEALAAMEVLKKMAPGKWWVYAQRGRTLSFAKKLNEALEDFNRAAKMNPKSGALYSWRGEALRNLGRYGEAEKDFQKAVELDPEYSFSWECLGRLKLMQGRLKEAYEALNRAIELDPARRLLSFAFRGEAAFKLGKLRQAWKDFERAHPLNPQTTWNVMVCEGQIVPRVQRQEAFWRDLENCVEKKSKEALPWLIRGRFKAIAGKKAEAEEDFKRAVEKL